MEFHITPGPHGPDLASITQMLLAADPAAVMDRDPLSGELRVATTLDGLGLLTTLRNAGWPIDASQLRPVATTCCGGCGG